MNDVADKLFTLRVTQHLSRREVAEHVGISQRSLQYYESGDRLPSLTSLGKLSRAYNCTFIINDGRVHVLERSK